MALTRMAYRLIPRIPSPFAFRAVCNGVVEVVGGEFEVTVAGTIQPSFLLSVAAAATVKAGTSFRCTKIAAASVAGPWSA